VKGIVGCDVSLSLERELAKLATEEYVLYLERE
jgi:hypothetical protein